MAAINQLVLLFRASSSGPEPLAENGELLHIDENNKLAWIFLPRESQPSFARIHTPSETVQLGNITAETRDGALAYFRLDHRQLEKLSPLFAVGSRLISPAFKAQDQLSLHDYVQGVNPEIETLRAIAWLCSESIGSKAVPLSQTLQGLTTVNLVDALTADLASPARSRRLLDELWDVLEARRLVLLLGGDYSGLSDFLPQFANTIPNRAEKGCHLTVDFDASIYDVFFRYLDTDQHYAILVRARSDAASASLFMSLAYAVFQSVERSSTLNRESLHSFIPTAADTDPNEFALAYLNFLRISTLAVQDRSPITKFLAFVAKLLDSAGTGHDVTVLLSFPSLTRWLSATRGEQGAAGVARTLWTQLSDFTHANYDQSGRLNADSLLATSAKNVRLLVEMRRPSLSQLGRAFCRKSVVMLPPYCESELVERWRRRFGAPPASEVTRHLAIQTGGAPWFVETVLMAFEPTGPAPTLEVLMDAIVNIKLVFADRAAVGPIAQRIRLHVDLYQRALLSGMTPAALLDGTTLAQLHMLSDQLGPLPPKETYVEWLEVGLIWLKDPQNPSSLLVFGSFPHAQAYPVAPLVDLAFQLVKRESPAPLLV